MSDIFRRFRRRSPRDRAAVTEDLQQLQNKVPVKVLWTKPEEPVSTVGPNILIVKPRHYLESCAIVRDEIDLHEWVAYQFVLGFEYVHLFDNESRIPVTETLKNWIKDSKVAVSPIPGRKVQNRSYAAYAQAASSRWVSFFDVDEFVVPHNADDMKTLLEPYETFGGLAIPWAVFSSNAHDARPKGLVTENYTKRGPVTFNMNNDPLPQYKTIAQPEKMRGCGNPHWMKYLDGWYAVDTRGFRLPGKTWGDASDVDVQLNHYIMKSKEDFKLKQDRHGGMSDRPRKQTEFDRVEKACNAFDDTRIFRFLPAVKALMEQYK